MLYILFFAELLMRFNYWGIQSLLVLYLVKHLSYSYPSAYHLYGTFTALTFLFSILGGFLADKVYGFKNSLLIGITLSLLGNVLLLSTPHLFVVGLIFISLGVGIFIPNNSNLIGNLYQQQDTAREQGFSIYYIGTNLGALMGPLVYGLLAFNDQWRPALILSLCLNLFFLLIFFIANRNKYAGSLNKAYLERFPVKKTTAFFATLVTSIIVFAGVLLSNDFKMLGVVLNVVCICSIAYIVKRAFTLQKKTRQAILKLLMVMPLSIVFFAIAYQIGDSLVIFTDKFVDRSFFSWTVPANIFISFEALFIVLFAPLMGRFWQKSKAKKASLSIFTQFSAGFLFTAISFAVFAVCAYKAMVQQHLISLAIFIPGYAFLAIGELCIMPPLIAAITKDIPKALRGSVMGLLFLLISYSAYMSVIIASLTVSNTNLHVTPAINYVHIYRDLLLIALVIAGITFIIGKVSSGQKDCLRGIQDA
jgi:POT family proton-dependent oligopeptide transporter